MAELRGGDHVVMIGSGPFPITAILLYTEFGIRVTAVDCDHGAVEISRQVIKQLGLERGISVELGQGQSFVPSDFSSVIVALLAHPKELILQNIFANYRHRSKVICRTSHGVRQALYRATDPSAFALFKPITTRRAIADQTISSILLVRGDVN
jgi:precorrin-6B methylase 2